MADDVVVNKAATIERFVARAREEYGYNPATFAGDFTRQDAAVMNVQRAREAALDLGQHLIRREHLGVPQGARDVFDLLARGRWIDADLAEALKRMVARGRAGRGQRAGVRSCLLPLDAYIRGVSMEPVAPRGQPDG